MNTFCKKHLQYESPCATIIRLDPDDVLTESGVIQLPTDSFED